MTRLHAYDFRGEFAYVDSLLRVPLLKKYRGFFGTTLPPKAVLLTETPCLYKTKPSFAKTDFISILRLSGLNAPTREQATARVTFVKADDQYRARTLKYREAPFSLPQGR